MTNDDEYVVTSSVNGDVWLAKFAPESNAPPHDSSPDNGIPIVPVPATVAVIAVATVAGLLLYHGKRKR